MLRCTLFANGSHILLEHCLIRIRCRHIGFGSTTAIDECLVSIFALLLMNAIEIALESIHFQTGNVVATFSDFLETSNDFLSCLVVRELLGIILCLSVLSNRFFLLCDGFFLRFLCWLLGCHSFVSNWSRLCNRFSGCFLRCCSFSFKIFNFSCYRFCNCCFFSRCRLSFLYSACVFSQWFLLDFFIGLFDVCHRWG